MTVRYGIALIVCTVVFQLCVYHADKSPRISVETTDNMEYLHVIKSPGKLFTNLTSVSVLNVVLPALLDYRNETFDCRKMTLTDMTFQICYFTNGEYISSFLLRGIYYEGKSVTSFLRLLRLDRKLQLVDIGANIGVYSLPAARVTHVIAVEPNWRTMLRLAKAVDIGGVNSNITLVQNAVYSVRTTLRMSVNRRNQGNAYLIDRPTTKCEATPNDKPYCNSSLSVKTILLNDLLPLMRSKSALIKVDVVGHEVDVFTNATAGQFFDQVDVPAVMIEWFWCKRRSTDLVQRLLNFFHSRNYAAFTLRNSKLETDYRSWPYDVMFKQESPADARVARDSSACIPTSWIFEISKLHY